MLTDQQIIDKYGEAGDTDNLTYIQFPYPMRIAWDLTKTATKTLCHKLVKDNFTAVFNDLLASYGLAELQRLEIDLFGGLYNARPMRGTEKWKVPKWSRHSWGIAIDLSPTKNALKMKKPAAQFSQPEYIPMIEIFYKNGFKGLGPEENRDWMHFEIAS